MTCPWSQSERLGELSSPSWQGISWLSPWIIVIHHAIIEHLLCASLGGDRRKNEGTQVCLWETPESSERVQVTLTSGRMGQDGPLRVCLVDSGGHPTSLRELGQTGSPTQLQGPWGHSTTGSLSCSPHLQWEASLPGKRSEWTTNGGGVPPLLYDQMPK